MIGAAPKNRRLPPGILTRKITARCACWLNRPSAEIGPKEAAEYYGILADRIADDPALFLSLAQTSLAAGDRVQSRQAVEKALALQPDCGEACAILGLIDLAEGHDDSAFSALQKATRLSPASAAPWKALAELHAAKGNREAAVTTLRAGAESASNPSALLLALGRMLIGEGRLREAHAALERALIAQPEDTGALTALAETCSGLGQTAEAEQYLNKAIAIFARVCFRPSEPLVSIYSNPPVGLRKRAWCSNARSPPTRNRRCCWSIWDRS